MSQRIEQKEIVIFSDAKRNQVQSLDAIGSVGVEVNETSPRSAWEVTVFQGGIIQLSDEGVLDLDIHRVHEPILLQTILI